MTTIRKFIYVLVFLCLITTVEGQESIQQNYDPAGATTLRLENLNGSVKIVGSDAPTLSMEVRLTPSEYEVDVPDYKAPKPSFTFSQKGETLFLNIILPEEESPGVLTGGIIQDGNRLTPTKWILPSRSPNLLT